MALIHFLGVRTYSVELRRDLEELEKQFNDLVRRTAVLFANEPASKFPTNEVNDPNVTGLASPTNPVILTDTPGVLKTAMRSDGAPRLSQAIAPTWTAHHTWSVNHDVTPVTIQKTASMTTEALFRALDTDATHIAVINNDGLVAVNAEPENLLALFTVQGNEAPPPSNVVAWYKADTITGVSSGNNISTWADQSGNGRHLTAGGVTDLAAPNATRPKWFAATGAPEVGGGMIQNLPCVAFPGTSSLVPYLSIDTGAISLSVTPGWTIAMIVRDYEDAGGSAFFGGDNSLGDGSKNIIRAAEGGGAGTCNYQTEEGASTKHFSGNFSHADGNATEVIVLRAAAVTGDLRTFLNGTLLAAFPEAKLATEVIRYLGRDSVSISAATPCQKKALAEVIIFDRALTDVEAGLVSTYLLNRLAGLNPTFPFALAGDDIQHWWDSDENILSRIDGFGRFGFGIAPVVPVHVAHSGQQLRLGVTSTAYTGFEYSGSAAISYTLPATSAVGLLHNSAGSVWSWSLVNLTSATDVTGDLPLANIVQGSALSVLGVAGNATADHADIAAASDNTVFRRSGTAVGFGSIDISQSNTVGSSRLEYANFKAATAASRLLGRGSAGGGGNWEEITLGSNLTMTGTVLDSTGGGGSGGVVSVTTEDFELATVLLETLLTGDQASFTVTGFSSENYDYIEIELLSKTDRSAGDADNVLIALNTDTTDANYRRAESTGGSSVGNGAADDRIVALTVGTTANTTNSLGLCHILIQKPNSDKYRVVHSYGNYRPTATNEVTFTYALQWENTANDLNTITLTPSLGSNFKADSYCLIKGFKSKTVVTAVTGSHDPVPRHALCGGI